jgi:hypothetical protein
MRLDHYLWWMTAVAAVPVLKVASNEGAELLKVALKVLKAASKVLVAPAGNGTAGTASAKLAAACRPSFNEDTS